MNKKFTKVILPFLILFVVVGFFIYLFHKVSEKNTLSNEINYRLKWLPNAGFIGDLYADSYGFYLMEGLKVIVKPGGPELDAIRELQKGEASFGVASADQIIKAIEDSADIVVIAQIYRRNPVQWIYREKDVKIDTISDLIKYKVGITIGDNDETIMKALLNMHNIPLDKMGLIPVKYSYLPFTKGEVNLFPVYLNTQGVELKFQLGKSNERTGFFDPESHGIHFVANSIITTSKVIKENEGLVLSFLKAAVKGWNESLKKENLELSIRCLKHNIGDIGTDQDISKVYGEQISKTRDLVMDSIIPIGKIDESAWKMTEEIMLKQGIISNSVDIDSHIDNRFINKIINGSSK
jgi:NitT/TauT family transport system substrate-binding protein